MCAALRTSQRVQRDGQYEPDDRGPVSKHLATGRVGNNACCSCFIPSSAAGSHLAANASEWSNMNTHDQPASSCEIAGIPVKHQQYSHRATLMLGVAAATSRAPNFNTGAIESVGSTPQLAAASEAADHSRPNRAVCEPCVECGSTFEGYFSFRGGNAAHTATDDQEQPITAETPSRLRGSSALPA